MARPILDGPFVPTVPMTDQEKRERIPKRSDLKTKYHPCNDWLMIKALEEMSEKGGIIIPGIAQRLMMEGHIIELGPDVDKKKWHEGDCVFWEANAELRITFDEGDKWVLVRPMNIIMQLPLAELQAIPQTTQPD